MLRLIFTFFVTAGLLAGATLFFGTEAEVGRVGEALEPVVERAVGLASETAERLEEEARAAIASRGSRVGGARALPETEAAGPEGVETVLLDEQRGEPFVEGPLPEAPAVSEPFDDTPPDQEAWAGLIRRMLALYARVGTER